MHDEIVRILYLLVNKKTISDGDQQILDQWISESEHNRRLYEEVMDEESIQRDVKTSLDYDSKPLWKKISKGLFPKKNHLFSFRNPFLRYAAAAALILGVVAYFLVFNKAPKEITGTANTKPRLSHDIAPGGDKATLTLANGSTIILDNSRNGVIIQQEGTTVTNQGAQLEYTTGSASTAVNHPVTYHTLSTPRGGQYQLLLPDGSKVFLNASSSIIFPTAFPGKERKVEITGEAFFEIANDASKPFKVKINAAGGISREIEVLGTTFNINAYNDERDIRITLVEGSVQVSQLPVAIGTAAGSPQSMVIKPGQQAILTTYESRLTTNESPDIDEVMAWKNGLFIFRKNDIQTIMRQLARWYDVDVEFQDNIPGHFVVTGISRTMPVSRLLEILEMAGGVVFEIREKEIIVKKGN